MKLLVVSDIVEKKLLKAPSACRGNFEAIIACGDLPPEYLISLRNLYDAPLFYVLGNHDNRYKTKPPVGCTPLHRRMVNLHGLRIVGFSGSRWYNHGVNQYSEKEMARFIRNMRFLFWWRGAPDIVITHAPPRGFGDREDQPHRGFPCFVKFIHRYRPKYLLHGHIHRHFTSDTERITTLGSTTIINCFGSHVLEIDP
jgi:Icc-related predicted phosphoesterase